MYLKVSDFGLNVIIYVPYKAKMCLHHILTAFAKATNETSHPHSLIKVYEKLIL